MPGNEKQILSFLLNKKNINLKLKHLGKIDTIKIPHKNKLIAINLENLDEFFPDDSSKKADVFINDIGCSLKQKGGNFSYNRLQRKNLTTFFCEFIDDTKILNSVYSCADLFVASSIQDGWPKTFAEAMYCKTPVVCFSNTSIAEIVNHKINGYVVQNFDSNQLKDGIEWLSREIDNTVKYIWYIHNYLNSENIRQNVPQITPVRERCSTTNPSIFTINIK